MKITLQTTQSLPPQPTIPHPHHLLGPGDARARIDPKSERSVLHYIHWLHYNAIRALLGYPAYTIQNPAGRPMEAHKQDVMNFYAWSNVKWPAAFDREQELYTTPRKVGDGLQYSDFEGGLKPLMRLKSGSQAPTPLQKLALEIMSYTYPILSIELSPLQLESINPRQRFRKAKIDAYMQAVHHAWANGLPIPPPPALEERPAAPPANRQVIVRVGLDSLFLIVRASLVYWFLHPFSRTITGAAYVAWLLYELWQLWTRPAARDNANGQQNQQHRGGAGAAAAGGAGAGGAAGNQAAGNNNNNQNNNQQAGGGQEAAGAPVANGAANGNLIAINGGLNNVAPNNNNNGGPNQPNIWQRYARIGLAQEADAAMGVQAAEGRRQFRVLTWFHRAKMFVIMLILTIYPRYWTERQQILRERERDLRVHYGPIRENAEEERNNGEGSAANGQTVNGHSQKQNEEKNATPPPAPPQGWVGQYVDRARRGLL
ncbi:hypothetical protein CPB86DRAFT_823880 [Serendipita vermifera]|nr:hypothetical protein CPB86DRAFT_823880 [Serendipita vermifera]